MNKNPGPKRSAPDTVGGLVNVLLLKLARSCVSMARKGRLKAAARPKEEGRTVVVIETEEIFEERSEGVRQQPYDEAGSWRPRSVRPGGGSLPSEEQGREEPGRGLGLSRRNLLTVFFFAILLGGLYLAYRLLSPFLDALIVAVVFAAIFHPIYIRLKSLLWNQPLLAASAMVLGITILVAIPMAIFVIGIIPQMRQSGAAVMTWVSEAHLDQVLNSNLGNIFLWLEEHAPFLDLTITEVNTYVTNGLKSMGQTTLSFSRSFVGLTLNFAFNFFLFLVAFFFFTKDGAAMVQRIKYLTPLREEQEERIIQTLQRISRAVLVGGFLIAAMQGVAGGVALYFVGVPALFWGTVMAFASLVPVVGTGLVWVPVCLYLLIIEGNTTNAVLLALWCGVVVTSIDTFLRPILMRDASGLPILFLFLAILGGIQAFGVLGLLYGPLILTFAVVMLAIYGEEYEDHLEDRRPPQA